MHTCYCCNFYRCRCCPTGSPTITTNVCVCGYTLHTDACRIRFPPRSIWICISHVYPRRKDATAGSAMGSPKRRIPTSSGNTSARMHSRSTTYTSITLSHEICQKIIFILHCGASGGWSLPSSIIVACPHVRSCLVRICITRSIRSMPLLLRHSQTCCGRVFPCLLSAIHHQHCVFIPMPDVLYILLLALRDNK